MPELGSSKAEIIQQIPTSEFNLRQLTILTSSKPAVYCCLSLLKIYPDVNTNISLNFVTVREQQQNILKAENQMEYVVPTAKRLASLEYLGELFNPENSD